MKKAARSTKNDRNRTKAVVFIPCSNGLSLSNGHTTGLDAMLMLFILLCALLFLLQKKDSFPSEMEAKCIKQEHARKAAVLHFYVSLAETRRRRKSCSADARKR